MLVESYIKGNLDKQYRDKIQTRLEMAKGKLSNAIAWIANIKVSAAKLGDAQSLSYASDAYRYTVSIGDAVNVLETLSKAKTVNEVSVNIAQEHIAAVNENENLVIAIGRKLMD